jgi:hypothetical protein
MSAYSRDPQAPKPSRAAEAAAAAAAAASPGAQQPISDAPIPFDGFQHVLEMLRAADPAFRESLLRRLAARDARLARDLRADLAL